LVFGVLIAYHTPNTSSYIPKVLTNSIAIAHEEKIKKKEVRN
jgi:hypothetical protein